MRRVLVSVEGQTEEALVTQVLQGHLLRHGVWLQPVVVQTKRLASGRKHRGGIASWQQARRDIMGLLGDTAAAMVTTMYDLYALPADVPGMADREQHPPGLARARHVEAAMAEDVGDPRFLPYLSLHEVEALVLAAPADTIQPAAAASAVADLTPLQGLPEPETINESDPPSKRLLACWPDYSKSIDGPQIVAKAGVTHVRGACPHFGSWLEALEGVGTDVAR